VPHERQLAAEIARLGLTPDACTWQPTVVEFASVLLGGEAPYKCADHAPTFPTAGNLTTSTLRRVENLLDGEPQIVVEVGSLYGRSASFMAQRWPNATVICIDTWLGDVNMTLMECFRADHARLNPCTFEKFLANTEMFPNIVPLRRSSLVGLKLLWVFALRADVIYLDSAHEGGESLLELEHAWNLLRPGGILFGDDYGGFPGLTHDVDTFRAGHRLDIEFTDPSVYLMQKGHG